MADPPTPNADARDRERIAALVTLLEKALRYAFAGSAEHGSFLRLDRAGEWVPSVFMTLEELRTLLSSQAARLEAQQGQLAKAAYDIGAMNEILLASEQRAEAAEARCTAAEQEIEKNLDWLKQSSFIVERKGSLAVVDHSDAMHALLFVRAALRPASGVDKT